MKPDFADVYDEHIWDVYSFFAYRLGGRSDAEDLTQATFERALKAWKRFDPARASPKTWLLAIAHNLLIDHFRADRSSKQQPLGDGELPADGRHEAAAEEHRLGVSPDLGDALESLSDRARVIVALRYGGDLTGPEIADMLDLSLSNVQQILSRSLRELHRVLDAATAVEARH